MEEEWVDQKRVFGSQNMLTAVIYEGNVYGGKYQVNTDMSLMKVEEKRETFPRGGGKV